MAHILRVLYRADGVLIAVQEQDWHLHPSGEASTIKAVPAGTLPEFQADQRERGLEVEPVGHASEGEHGLRRGVGHPVHRFADDPTQALGAAWVRGDRELDPCPHRPAEEHEILIADAQNREQLDRGFVLITTHAGMGWGFPVTGQIPGDDP